VQVVIDHLDGSRRGERQVLPAAPRLLFGRHPDADVAFGAEEDLDASGRHAELREFGGGWVLVDLGSSNGTFVNGHRVTEVALAVQAPQIVQFGPAGPRLRVLVADEDTVRGLAPLELPRPARPRWVMPAMVASVAAALLVAYAILR
jgi:hypothetical protein